MIWAHFFCKTQEQWEAGKRKENDAPLYRRAPDGSYRSVRRNERLRRSVAFQGDKGRD